MNERIYLLTGAAGFLGSNICAQLLAEGKKVRALVLPNDKSVKFIPKDVEVVIGDLTDADSLEPFFVVPAGCSSVVIHCAPTPTQLTNEEIRESGATPQRIKAMEHDISDVPGIGPVAAYKAVEKGAVDACHKVEDTMVDKLFRKEGETVEQTRDRLRRQ